MLPLINRLPAKRIPELLRVGQKFATPLLKAIVQKTETGKPCRLAILIPKRIYKRATARNKTKRLLKERIRHHINCLDPGNDALVVLRKELSQDNHCLEKEVEDLFKKAGLIKKDDQPKTHKT